jgi:hypothetical protein
MTKKSEARKFRDRQKAEQKAQIQAEGRKGWDEVAKISEGCLAGLIIPTTFKDHLQNKQLLAFLTRAENVDLAEKVKLLQKDLMFLLEKLKVLRAKHKDKTGAEANFEEVFATYGLVNEYAQWQQEYDAFILPTKGDILQHLSNAEARQNMRTQQLATDAGETAAPVDVQLVQRDGATCQEDLDGNPVPLGTEVNVVESETAPVEVRMVEHDGATVQEDLEGNPVPLGTKVTVVDTPASA